MSEPWRPRPHDHLVEPLFGGLGHEAPPGSEPRPRARSARVALAWIVLALVAVLALTLVLLL